MKFMIKLLLKNKMESLIRVMKGRCQSRLMMIKKIYISLNKTSFTQMKSSLMTKDIPLRKNKIITTMK